MIGLAIAAVFGFPIVALSVFLSVGFLGVSQKRAEEGRAHIAHSSSGDLSGQQPAAQHHQQEQRPHFAQEA